ncbi:hypothetical protein DFH27DRAFT_537139 [Peziza echinospora]|nr:hypothetical protein DFH27DRAFT_537139 [Peziza echinospora]
MNPVKRVNFEDDESSLSDCITVASPTPPPATLRATVQKARVPSTASNSKPSPKEAKAGSASGSKQSKYEIPDSEGEDSDDVLLSLEDLLPKRAKQKPAAKKEVKKSLREMPFSPRKKTISAADFLRDTILQQQEDKDFEAALSKLGNDDLSDDDEFYRADLDDGTDQFIINAAVGDENGEKLVQMLARREAFKVEFTYHFFDQSIKARPRNPFPLESVPDLLSELTDPSTRYDLFLTGYVQDIAALLQELPEQLVSWILEEFILEKRQHLSYAYMKTLESCPSQVSDVLDPPTLCRLFELLGGRKEAVDITEPVVLVKSTKHVNRVRELWNLKLLVNLLGSMAAHLKIPTIITAIDILIRLSLDESVNRIGEVLTEIEASISSLLMSIPQSSWDTTSAEISRTITKTFEDPKCQIRLLKSLPVTSPRTHLFRRRIALAFIFKKNSYLTKSYDKLVNVIDFSVLLQDPKFKVRHNTDYTLLKALIELLDMALDDGATTNISGGQAPRIEAVAATLQDLSSNIKDAGMASLERTEAKQMIELTQFRLQYSVAKGKKGPASKQTNPVGQTDTCPVKKKQSKLTFEKM